MTTLLRNTSLALLAMLTITCSKDKKYNVPGDVEVYVQRFEQEAKARGYDVEIKRLIVTMVDNLESGGAAVAGRCNGQGARRPEIELDTKFPNLSPELQEQLVFHELGHCILDRAHKDGILSNGHFNSIMNTHFWNFIGGQEFKRDYYLDELFSEIASEPSWTAAATTYDAVDTALFNNLMDTEFDNVVADLNVGNGHSGSQYSGLLRLRTHSTSGLLYYLNYNQTQSIDYQIEASFRILDDAGQPCAIAWEADGQLKQFGYNRDGKIFLGDLDLNEAVVTTYAPGFNANGFNKLTVRVVDDMAYFFINEHFVDKRIMQQHIVNAVGFFVGQAAIMEAENMTVNEVN